MVPDIRRLSRKESKYNERYAHGFTISDDGKHEGGLPPELANDYAIAKTRRADSLSYSFD